MELASDDDNDDDDAAPPLGVVEEAGVALEGGRGVEEAALCCAWGCSFKGVAAEGGEADDDRVRNLTKEEMAAPEAEVCAKVEMAPVRGRLRAGVAAGGALATPLSTFPSSPTSEESRDLKPLKGW